jgi:hypothetical protein
LNEPLDKRAALMLLEGLLEARTATPEPVR